VLQVAVDRDHGAAARVGQPGRQRDVLAEVARQPHHLEPVVLGARREQHAERVVAAAVVDEHDLPRLAEPVEHRRDRREERREVPGLVVRGRDDRHHGVHARSVS